MSKRNAVIIALCLFIAATGLEAAAKTRIFIVSSYSRDYLWSQDTAKGVAQGLIDFKFLDDQAQADELTANDYVETENTVIKKAWMDTKRKNSKEQITATALAVAQEIEAFKPDIILLGDDNATNHVGNMFLDKSVPVVFWGVDGFPLKYGLIDTVASPGHNVTGVYQPGYYKEGMQAFIKLKPEAKKFAILADGSETGKAKAKALHKLAETGELPLELAEKAVSTNSFEEFQKEAKRLEAEVDVFFVMSHHTMKDGSGAPVEAMKAGAWYLNNIAKPEIVPERHLVAEGMLMCADDSGYKQGYEAVRIADAIIHGGKKPAEISAVAPARGNIIVNKKRAAMLGIDLTGKDYIEEYIDEAKAVEQYPAQ